MRREGWQRRWWLMKAPDPLSQPRSLLRRLSPVPRSAWSFAICWRQPWRQGWRRWSRRCWSQWGQCLSAASRYSLANPVKRSLGELFWQNWRTCCSFKIFLYTATPSWKIREMARSQTWKKRKKNRNWIRIWIHIYEILCSFFPTSFPGRWMEGETEEMLRAKEGFRSRRKT